MSAKKFAILEKRVITCDRLPKSPKLQGKWGSPAFFIAFRP